MNRLRRISGPVLGLRPDYRFPKPPPTGPGEMRVFLSVGATFTPQQEAFVSAFEAFLGQNGCEELTVGRGKYFSNQPIVSARELMESADGVVVIAFTRQLAIKSLDKPQSDKETKITNSRYPTVWNQLEAAMAFGLKLPLLVIVEKGLMQEAMLKDRLEYRALITELEPSFFSSEEFKGIFAHWKQKATSRPAAEPINTPVEPFVIKDLTVGKLIKELPPEQFWKVGSAVVGSIAGVAGAAFWLGKTLGGP